MLPLNLVTAPPACIIYQTKEAAREQFVRFTKRSFYLDNLWHTAEQNASLPGAGKQTANRLSYVEQFTRHFNGKHTRDKVYCRDTSPACFQTITFVKIAFKHMLFAATPGMQNTQRSCFTDCSTHTAWRNTAHLKRRQTLRNNACYLRTFSGRIHLPFYLIGSLFASSEKVICSCHLGFLKSQKEEQFESWWCKFLIKEISCKKENVSQFYPY